MENHAQRPEVVDARENGLGRAQRYSATLQIDMLYVAVPVAHPAIAFVRVALPLTDVRQQLRPILTATLAALGFALVGAAAIAWMFSARIGRRVRRLRSSPSATGRATSRRRGSGSATTSSARWRGRSTSRCRRSGAGSPSRRAIARGWKRSSPAWSKA